MKIFAMLKSQITFVVFVGYFYPMPALADAEAIPPKVDSSIWTLKSYGDHRMIIQRVCNPAHCTTLGFLEFLTSEYPKTIKASLPITELNSSWWAFVSRVEVVVDDSGYHFNLYAEDTHGTDAGFILRISPDGGQYIATKRDERSP